MHSIFVSDLHLCDERPQINAQFFDFLMHVVPPAEALYLLGDVFEYWLGDDDPDDRLADAVAVALRRVAHAGTALYFMHGNRDVLVGEEYAARCGARVIRDPALLDLYGTPTLLMPGDTLCTDDVEYQKFRTQVRNPDFQRRFLAQPLAQRKQQVGHLRAVSEQAKQEKIPEIMDVAPAAVEQALRAHGYPRLIHGHTHRPARHVHVVDGHTCERWVLPAWYDGGGYLRAEAGGCRAVSLG
jgi:UDP-2,3-diacylglucosamine hydrolase